MLKTAIPFLSTHTRLSSIFTSLDPRILYRQNATQTPFLRPTEIAPPPPFRSVRKRTTVYQLPVDDEESSRLST